MRQFGEGGAPLENNARVKGRRMSENSDKQLALFVRDEKTGRLAFTVQALKALGINPARRENELPSARKPTWQGHGRKGRSWPISAIGGQSCHDAERSTHSTM